MRFVANVKTFTHSSLQHMSVGGKVSCFSVVDDIVCGEK